MLITQSNSSHINIITMKKLIVT